MADPQLLFGEPIADRIKRNLEKDIAGLPEPPQLRILYFNTPPSLLFKLVQSKAAVELGIAIDGSPAQEDSQCCDWASVTPDEVDQMIQRWNQNPRVHGIFVHQPLPAQLDAQRISASIDPQKDVEGIHPQNSARRFFAKARIGSCTALAVMELIEEALRRSRETLEGKEAVVVGHSEIVGRPVSMLLLDKLATTTVCHLGTDKVGRLEEHVRRADVLVVAIGRPQFIKGDWIKKGAIVIDVGINVVGGRVVGDVDAETAKARAGFITPVPGGVGPITVMMVMKNTVEAFKLQHAKRP